VLRAIAFCPTPPLLVPEVAAGAAGELDPLRAACRDAVGRLLGSGPDEVVVIATGPVTRQFPPGTTGTLAPYGVAVTAALPGGPPQPRPARNAGPYGVPDPRLPLGITLGAWLLADAQVPCSAWSIGPETDPAELGAGLDRTDRRRALLVMGDGSARRSERAPGYVDPRAPAFDASVAAALATGDAAALRGLDPALAAELLAAGAPAWRVTGHAATGPYEAALLHDAAPYGVGYLVATWRAP
jgi:hypothetical protein